MTVLNVFSKAIGEEKRVLRIRRESLSLVHTSNCVDEVSSPMQRMRLNQYNEKDTEIPAVKST